MSLFRHSVWFSFSVEQFPSADFGICNICSSVQADFYWFSLYSFHNFSLRFILKIFLKFRKFKLPYSYKALRVYLLPIDLTLAAFPTHGPDRWIRQQSRNVPPRSPSVIKVSRLKIPQWPLRMRTSQRELSVALPFRVYGERVFQLVRFPKNVLLSRDERNPFFLVFSSSCFFLLVCYQCCQRLASLVLVLLLLFVLFLRLSVSVLRLWDFLVVFGGRLGWRAGRWRSSPFVLLLFWGGTGLCNEDVCFVITLVVHV